MKLDPLADAETLRENARCLLDGTVSYYTGHCTGVGQYGVLKEIMGERLQYLSTGSVYEI